MKSDYERTGKLYPKLDSYMISKRPESVGVEVYWGSSNQFATHKAYKSWLTTREGWEHLNFRIKKGE